MSMDDRRKDRGSPVEASPNHVSTVAPLVARLALGASFLSAVADRFGGYGPPGAPHVAWGDFAHFTAYTGKINPFAPLWLVPILAWAATVAEIGAGVLLLAGLYTRIAALVAAGLLAAFALTMTVSLGIKAPLDYSVFSAGSAALLLAIIGSGSWSVDAWRERARERR
jgi:uncharacterized membrane protein YphA (DoxX/SURF4 family)